MIIKSKSFLTYIGCSVSESAFLVCLVVGVGLLLRSLIDIFF